MKILLKIKLALLFISLLLSCNSKPETVKIENQKRSVVQMVTSHGTMSMELFNETPLHRDNFIKLVNKKAYDSLLFHRVIESFMIQGGDPESRNAASKTLLGEGDLGYTVKAEFNPTLFHKKGALATARIESLDRVSSAIQFYIVQGKVLNDSLIDTLEYRINKMLARHYTINDSLYRPLWLDYTKAIDEDNKELYNSINDSINAIAKSYSNFKKYAIPQSHRDIYKTIGGTPHLDQNYTVFGQVIEGLQVIDSIAKIDVDENNRPLSDVRILSVRLKN
ncbi:peptidylprolyl isomerase [Ichthyenterobacterium magnum]|uniref:peptidylprolyl isomerase n=1 Tax=Ichthyenterobacterium magnum TaxID=1230530 RepID=A0A420DKR0_9FLAO|nr:peptidylprolyl isomerase [Ichthyenterobacterium magnum]RKE94778.1 peptidyl-prolyl cis-trans isomerase B (cyclophilin B) [Ichthyenterobacterium magnum]